MEINGLGLPQELICHIFSFLPVSDHLKLAAVCRVFKLAADDALFWRKEWIRDFAGEPSHSLENKEAYKQLFLGLLGKMKPGCRQLQVDMMPYLVHGLMRQGDALVAWASSPSQFSAWPIAPSKGSRMTVKLPANQELRLLITAVAIEGHPMPLPLIYEGGELKLLGETGLPLFTHRCSKSLAKFQLLFPGLLALHWVNGAVDIGSIVEEEWHEQLPLDAHTLIAPVEFAPAPQIITGTRGEGDELTISLYEQREGWECATNKTITGSKNHTTSLFSFAWQGEVYICLIGGSDETPQSCSIHSLLSEEGAEPCWSFAMEEFGTLESLQKITVVPCGSFLILSLSDRNRVIRIRLEEGQHPSLFGRSALGQGSYELVDANISPLGVYELWRRTSIFNHLMIADYLHSSSLSKPKARRPAMRPLSAMMLFATVAIFIACSNNGNRLGFPVAAVFLFLGIVIGFFFRYIQITPDSGPLKILFGCIAIGLVSLYVFPENSMQTIGYVAALVGTAFTVWNESGRYYRPLFATERTRIAPPASSGEARALRF